MDTDRDTLHPNTDMECSGHQVTFQFQLGLVRDKVTADTVDLNLKSLKSMACDFVAEKCPANGITRMQERVLLFKHDYQSTNILQVGNKHSPSEAKAVAQWERCCSDLSHLDSFGANESRWRTLRSLRSMQYKNQPCPTATQSSSPEGAKSGAIFPSGNVQLSPMGVTHK